jgi:hypothetical protein
VSSSALLRRIRQLKDMVVYHSLHDLRRKYFLDSLNDFEPRITLGRLTGVPSMDEIGGVDALLTLIGEISESGAIPLVVLTPNEVQLFTEEFDEINRRIRLLVEATGALFLDPLDAMRQSPDRRHLFCDGLHFSSAGHRFVADWMEGEIRSLLGESH